MIFDVSGRMRLCCAKQYQTTSRIPSLPSTLMLASRIAERGTFDEMMANRDDFSRTFDEFIMNDLRAPRARRKFALKTLLSTRMQRNDELARRGATIMQAEERNIGAVNLQVYKQYFQSGNGAVLLPVMFATIVLMQASVVLLSYSYVLPWYRSVTWQALTNAHADRLVWWHEQCVVLRFCILHQLIPQNSQWNLSQGFYVYIKLLSVFDIASLLFTFRGDFTRCSPSCKCASLF